MTKYEAINRFKGIKESFSISVAQSNFYPSKDIQDELCDIAIESLSAETEWIPLSHEGLGTDFPYERDGEWVIVTNGSAISVERIKKDAQDHFLPDGRWFELEDVIAWMPLPKPYGERREP